MSIFTRKDGFKELATVIRMLVTADKGGQLPLAAGELWRGENAVLSCSIRDAILEVLDDYETSRPVVLSSLRS